MMRAAEGRLNEAPAESEANLAELLTGTPPMRARYLALGPLGELRTRATARPPGASWSRSRTTRTGRCGRARRSWRRGCPTPPGCSWSPRTIRSRGYAEAALGALAAGPNPSADAVRAGVDALEHEGWWFVKTQAVALLANAPASRDVDDALGGALHDPSVNIRGGAIVALARRRALPWRPTIRERLDDTGEDLEIRGAAARALGALCDTDSVDRLSELVRALGSAGHGRRRAAARLRRARGPGGAAPAGPAEPRRVAAGPRGAGLRPRGRSAGAGGARHVQQVAGRAVSPGRARRRASP